MCFADTPEIQKPAQPPEVLDQDAPKKKTANQRGGNSLAIGSKSYRNESGVGGSNTTAPNKLRPQGGPSVSV